MSQVVDSCDGALGCVGSHRCVDLSQVTWVIQMKQAKFTCSLTSSLGQFLPWVWV